MPKADVSSDDLIRFAKELEKFSGNLEREKSRIERLINSLDWHDQEHKKFTDDFTHTMSELKKFLGIVPGHIDHLKKKAKIIEEYGS